MPDRDSYDPYRDENRPKRPAAEIGEGGWRTAGQARSFGGDRTIHQGQATYAQEDQSQGARRSESRETGNEGLSDPDRPEVASDTDD